MQKYVVQFHNQTITIVEGRLDRMLFLLLAGILGISFAFYLVFVFQTSWNVMKRNQLEAENRVLSSKLSELELSYISATSKIDLNLAYAKGFKDSTRTSFVSRGSISKALSYAKNDL